MTVWRLQCRTHGGIFEMPSRRGRKPVRCTDDNQCTRATSNKDTSASMVSDMYRTLRGEKPAVVSSRAAALANKIKNKRTTVKTAHSNVDKRIDEWEAKGRPRLGKRKRELRTQVKQEAPITVTVNNSLPPMTVAREALIAKGWEIQNLTVSSPSVPIGSAELIAVRGDEIIAMRWENGVLRYQNYSMWNNGHPPTQNNRPKSRLDFDPEELTDKEIARLISGQKVTWWNKLGSSEETAIVGDKVRINHTFIGGRADENPGERVITFVDREGGGYRSFYVSALIKVG